MPSPDPAAGAIVVDGVRLLDPTLRDTRDRAALAPRLGSLDGVRFGLLANGKTHGGRLLDLIVEDLSTRHRLGPVTRVRKAHPSRPPTDEQIEMLAEHALAILSAIGD
ncbi:MAG TPA: hypothetical protein VFP61_15875 [Acidimicrobiales bacterium]|nr:hypothetical protein [Acidimicrobiales bacterium]